MHDKKQTEPEELNLKDRLISAGFKQNDTHAAIFSMGNYQVNLNKPIHAEMCLNEILNNGG
jgi:hypothetical protein